MDRDDWRFINSFAPWLSAIGTLSAVLISLYLSSRDRPRVRVRADVRRIAGGDLPPELRAKEYIDISVTNVGRRGVQVTGIHWKIGFLKKTFFYQVPDANPWTARIPTRLEEGEQADFMLDADKFFSFAACDESWRAAFKSPFTSLRVALTKMCANTSVGKTFEARIDASLRRRLEEELRKAAPNASRKTNSS